MVVTTFATVGYGDFSPVSVPEIVWTIFYMVRERGGGEVSSVFFFFFFFHTVTHRSPLPSLSL